jgi:23S rRNA (cytidine1920-2'-O)/16S rRNA (cytidine1409-2'-O)-methyltransferase
VARRRLDEELVRRGLATDREDAVRAVRGGLVTVRGAPVRNAASMVAAEEPVGRMAEDARYVSRGGEKLDAALVRFAVDPTGVDALDAGASTGGFTDCLLRHGAARVIAVDVGYGDLAWSLRNDPRVHVMERTNVRDLARDSIPFRPDLIVADLSFISLRIVVEVFARIAEARADHVLLVKPQFEAGPADVGKGGVVRDAATHRRVLREVAEAALAWRAQTAAVVDSGLPGPKGNREFFLYLLDADDPRVPDELDSWIARALE